MPLYPRTGNQGLASPLNQALAQPTCYLPWPGFRHPCRNDGFAGLVYNDESQSLGTTQITQERHIPAFYIDGRIIRISSPMQPLCGDHQSTHPPNLYQSGDGKNGP